MALLPIYALERGASKTSSGLFLAFAYLCLALGTVATGLLSKDFKHRKWLIVTSGLLMVSLLWLISKTTTFLQLAGATGLSWFLGGVVFSQAATLTGLAADSTDRGVAFGILGMTNGLGSLIGGIGIGYIAEHFGFTVVYESMAAFCILILIGGFISVESPGSPATSPVERERSHGTTLGVLLVLLLVSQLMLSVTIATGGLGRSLTMSRGGFSKFAINVTTSISGIVILCISLLLGWLSDRIGRRWIMIVIYLVMSASLVLLAFSRTIWQFYVSAGLSAFSFIPFSVGPAYIMDIVPKERAARGVSLFQTAFWAGTIVGMAATGLAFDKLGTRTPILLSSLFPIVGVILLLLIREQARGE
jgi:DHA1 family tetracycline resistance protein-like MFS transporter